MDAFLTPAELVTLTGYVKPSKQLERLRLRGIPHEVNRFGRAVVLRDWRKDLEISEPEMGPVP